eukprot:gene19655-biopygen17802
MARTHPQAAGRRHRATPAAYSRPLRAHRCRGGGAAGRVSLAPGEGQRRERGGTLCYGGSCAAWSKSELEANSDFDLSDTSHCGKSHSECGDRTTRHNFLRNTAFRLAHAAGLRPELEKPGLLRPRPCIGALEEDGCTLLGSRGAAARRPADVFLPSFRLGSRA